MGAFRVRALSVRAIAARKHQPDLVGAAWVHDTRYLPCPFCFVSTRTSTDMPGASRLSSCWSGSSVTFTAMRWAIFTKLPVPLSALMLLYSDVGAG